MGQKIDLILDQGASFIVGFNILNANGSAVDASAYTANSQIRKTYTSNTYYSFSIGTYSNGLITLAMNSAFSNTIPAGRYVYDLEIIDGIGNKARVVEGIVDVTPQVTR
jgi:hypothetical protein